MRAAGGRSTRLPERGIQACRDAPRAFGASKASPELSSMLPPPNPPFGTDALAMADDPDEELEDVDEPDDPDIVDLESLDEDDDDLLEDDADELDADVDDVVDLDLEAEVETPVAVVVADDDDDDEDDEDIDPDDVEAGLDVILKDRLVVVDEEEDEEDDVPDAEDRAEGSTKVLPKRPGEFVCQSCFLVKHPSQLADPERMLCRDCV